MAFPAGVTYCTVVSVEAFDSLTNKPTMCVCKFDVNNVEYQDIFNIGLGFLASFNAAVVAIKRVPTVIAQAQAIVNNKFS